ncbi:MAG: aminotransferase class V-fold PLP-dependent enzyme [Desulfobacterales bacterium]|nr:aminotransferase class V-fold PLP-dependent enzyme [Desulfobacterales bacterium]
MSTTGTDDKRQHPAPKARNAEGRALVANWETLQQVFIRPENEAVRATLVKYMEQILFGLHDFLRDHVGITEAQSLKKLSTHFQDSLIHEHPRRKLAEVIQGIIEDLAPYAVNVASPYFVGHMTSAIPFFMVHLQTIVAALNQNLVKLETSKIISIHERQVLAKLHRRIFRRSAGFYRHHIQHPESTLGCFVEDGTLANLTALWVARNRCFPPKGAFEGIESEGLAAALAAHDARRAVVLVSRMGHYSLRKAGGVLGIGNRNVLAIETDGHYRMDLQALQNTIRELTAAGSDTRVIAVVGIAGATETGSVDDLTTIGRICRRHGIHFHVDAAWGGPTLMSERYAGLLEGIQTADSVTVDGHKQFYMPMGCGMVYFRDPRAMDAVAYHAAYVNRPGSVDLGIKSLVGSRAANSLILGGALDIMGAGGYAVLIDHGIETARAFAEAIAKRPLFELITPPVLNIITYRICPPEWQQRLKSADRRTRRRLTSELNRINTDVQRLQREAGRSFVSRTTLTPPDGVATVVLRAVIMNPMTDDTIVNAILDEQASIFADWQTG